MWLTLEEVAEHLRVSRETVYKLAQKGKIPAAKVGNQWRFRKDLLEAALVCTPSPSEGAQSPINTETSPSFEKKHVSAEEPR